MPDDRQPLDARAHLGDGAGALRELDARRAQTSIADLAQLAAELQTAREELRQASELTLRALHRVANIGRGLDEVRVELARSILPTPGDRARS